MDIGERIKYFRKAILDMTQQDFASSIMISRSNLGNIETGAVGVTERVITSICEKFNLNEDWLRNGNEPMYIETNTFDLSSFAKSKGVSELEISIIKAYFELDYDVRNKVMEHFKSSLQNSSEKLA